MTACVCCGQRTRTGSGRRERRVLFRRTCAATLNDGSGVRPADGGGCTNGRRGWERKPGSTVVIVTSVRNVLSRSLSLYGRNELNTSVMNGVECLIAAPEPQVDC